MDYSKKLLNFFDIDLINIFNDTVNYYCKNKRKSKYSTEYYLYHIVLVLKNLSSWKSLTYIYNNKPYHYKTIQDIHFKWSKLNIYKIVYDKLLRENKINYLKKSTNLTLFIDSSNIYNKYGSIDVGYGFNPKKKESKISVICDNNKNVYSLTLVKTYNKTATKKTLPHDSKTIQTSINDLLKNNLKYKKLFLVGDKGYALNKIEKEKLLKNKNIEIVYPNKRNQKNKTPIKYKKLLKERHKIENVFSILKRFDRINVRKDKLDITYLGFCFLALLETYKK